MASALKRKRGAVDMLDTPKRAKSVKSNPVKITRPLGDKVGWEAAFSAGKNKQELTRTNEINGDSTDASEDSDASVEFEAFCQEGDKPDLAERDKAAENDLKKAMRRKKAQAWKLSEPIAGRMINNDPVFTSDEKFLIVANRLTIHVYSSSNSLLTRSIKLNFQTRIVTYCLSPTQANILWIACANGAIFSIDWASGAGAYQNWYISSTGCIHMTVASMESAGRRRDVVFTTEMRKDGGWRITANELTDPSSSIKTEARTIYTSSHHVNFLKTANEGSVIVAASENRVLIGRLRSTEYDTIDKIRYEFRIFETSNYISCLDVRVTQRHATKESKKSVKKLPVVDLVVGDVKGSIFVHNDLLAKLVSSQDGSLPPAFNIMPRKLHWHRQAVLTVKWSLDGNYVISGGSETVLVLWQLDTGKQQFLPHMAATIQNVVVSPSGSSYAVQLADNSAMVLSTAELQPTASIAGIQLFAIEPEIPIKAHVWRLEDETWGRLVYQRTPAIINPMNPTRLLLCTGNTQEMSARNPLILSNPYLQTFDLASGHNLSRQALARTNVTNINIAPSAHRISEPRVTHIKISYDGKWLATVDEWIPPLRDIEFLRHQGKDLNVERQKRREVFLKFWQWNQETGSWELVSRINGPHDAGRVLDLAVDPSSLRFSTIGEDYSCRTWSTKSRKRGGVVVRGKHGEAFKNWECTHNISLGNAELDTSGEEANACVAFSEDGSVMAAACGSRQGLVHLIDPTSGMVQVSKTGLFDENIIRIEFLGQDLITLSNKLTVYDVCSYELRTSIRLAFPVTSLTIRQKQEMFHLAVDRKSRTFAVSLPLFFEADGNQPRAQSELVVFHQDKLQPQLQELLPTLVTALLPAVDSEGYFVLDTAAEIITVLKKGAQVVTAMAQPTSILHLDAIDEGLADEALTLEDSERTDEPEEEPGAVAEIEADDDDDDDNDTPVITQQQLSEIFDKPSYALPAMEDMFYQVAALCSLKPIVRDVGV